MSLGPPTAQEVGLIGGGSGVGWGKPIWWSIVPASLGNVSGGAILLALLFWHTYGHNAEKR